MRKDIYFRSLVILELLSLIDHANCEGFWGGVEVGRIRRFFFFFFFSISDIFDRNVVLEFAVLADHVTIPALGSVELKAFGPGGRGGRSLFYSPMLDSSDRGRYPSRGR